MDRSSSLTTYDTGALSWWFLFRQDLARYKSHRRNASALALLLTEQGLWAILQYRMAAAVYRSQLSWLPKRLLLIGAVITQKIVELAVGITIPYQATIGPGFYIGHFGNIVLGEDVVMGDMCNISQGVTIGVSGRGKRRGVPTIGDRVYIAANSVVAGKITVGDDAVIAASSLVVADVPAHTTVMGVPAQVINDHGSEEYLDPQ